jgi:hypothetical protein
MYPGVKRLIIMVFYFFRLGAYKNRAFRSTNGLADFFIDYFLFLSNQIDCLFELSVRYLAGHANLNFGKQKVDVRAGDGLVNQPTILDNLGELFAV